MKIPVYAPILGKEEREFLLSAFGGGRISGSDGEFLRAFERDFSRYSDCSHGVAVSNGTTALHVAATALGIGRGDEVLIPAFTNMATFFSVLYLGAKPVPIDIEPDTWNIDPLRIEEKLSERTKCIIAVHIYGHPADMDPILRIATKHGLAVIEDCAEAHGATYRGRKAGSMGDVGCFSFYANKIITTGEGGMVTTNRKEIADHVRSLTNLAFGDEEKFMHKGVGYNYRMSNLLAAIGCAQLKRINKIILRKRQIAHHYNDSFRDIEGLQTPVEKSYARNVYWMYHLVAHPDLKLGRTDIVKQLRDKGIETREAFVPYNQQKAFVRKKWTRPEECPVANLVGQSGFYLPSGPLLKEKELRYVSNALREILR